jgi:hypothetical protein
MKKQPKLYQLHWQNLALGKYDETQFVAQAGTDDFPDADALTAHFCEIIKRRRGECPEGWAPVICDEGCDCFVWSGAKGCHAGEGKA